MTRAKVVLVYPLPAPEVEADLRRHAEVMSPATDDEATLRQALDDADGVILRGPARLTASMINDCPSLRAIGAQGSGTDNIDVAAATARGIPVVHGAGVAPRAVAEYVIGAMVVGHRRMLDMHRTVTEGPLVWEERMWAYCGEQLTGSTLGVVGYGHIGREVARMAVAAFDVNVLICDPFLIGDVDLSGVECVGLEELFERSNTATVHVPLSEETRGLIGRDELRRLGPAGVLIDTARGGVVDEAAIRQALLAGELRAAVLDVFDPEPPSRQQIELLRGTPGLLVTPHVAGITGKGLAKLSRNVVDGVLAVLAGGRPAQVVNPEVYTRA